MRHTPIPLRLRLRQRPIPDQRHCPEPWSSAILAQQRQVEEARFAVNLSLVNVAGGNKVRLH